MTDNQNDYPALIKTGALLELQGKAQYHDLLMDLLDDSKHPGWTFHGFVRWVKWEKGPFAANESSLFHYLIQHLPELAAEWAERGKG